MDLLAELIPPLLEYMPEIELPSKIKPILIEERIKWTASILVIYLIMCQVVLYHLSAIIYSLPSSVQFFYHLQFTYFLSCLDFNSNDQLFSFLSPL